MQLETWSCGSWRPLRGGERIDGTRWRVMLCVLYNRGQAIFLAIRLRIVYDIVDRIWIRLRVGNCLNQSPNKSPWHKLSRRRAKRIHCEIDRVIFALRTIPGLSLTWCKHVLLPPRRIREWASCGSMNWSSARQHLAVKSRESSADDRFAAVRFPCRLYQFPTCSSSASGQIVFARNCLRRACPKTVILVADLSCAVQWTVLMLSVRTSRPAEG
jgi:hypothetical protein